MKKIVKISLILLSIMCVTLSAYAFSCSMSLDSTKNEYKPGDDVTVDVKLTNIDAADGIIALIATLEYDTNSLTYVSMQGQNGWETPAYSETSKKLIMSRNALVTTPETVLTINFKVKEQSAKNPTITLKNITASGGIATGDIPVADMTKTITVKTPVTPANNTVNTNTNTNTNTNPGTVIKPTNNTNTNTNTNAGATNENKAPTNPSTNSTIVATTSNSSTQPDSVKTGILPKTGATRVLLVVLGITAVVSVVFYIKMKKLDINMK